MYKKIISLIFFSFFLISVSFSQQLPIHNQVLINKFSLAPAYAGYSGHTESFASYRQSWVGIDGAPKLAMINMDGALGDNMGYGFSVMAENTGSFTQFYLTGTYAYHINFSDNSALNFGISPHLFRNQINLSKVRSYGTQLDPMLQNNSGLTVTAFDFGISSVLILNNFNFGLSVPRIIGKAFSFGESESQFQLQQHFMSFISFGFGSDKIFITPTAIVRKTETSKINYEALALIEFNHKIWTGLGYRADNSISLSAGGAVGDRLVINYSYDFGVGGLSSAASGTHEFTMGFVFKYEPDFREPTIFPVPLQQQENSNGDIEEKIKILTEMIKTEKEEREKDIDEHEKDINVHEEKIKDLQDQIDALDGNVGHVPKDVIYWELPDISPSIVFGSSDRILPASYGELEKYSEKLRDKTLLIRIVVHTDNMGSKQYNQDISDRRAKAVADYLIAKSHIEQDRVFAEGKGDTENKNETLIYFNKPTN